MKSYIWKHRLDDIHIINIDKIWQKIILTAHVIAIIENPIDVAIVNARSYRQWIVLKFTAHVEMIVIIEWFTLDAFINYNSHSFKKVFKSHNLKLITTSSYYCNESKNRLSSIKRRCKNVDFNYYSLRHWFISSIYRYCHFNE